MDGNGGDFRSELMKQLVALGAIPEEQNLLRDEMSMGQDMANSQMPQGYQTGRIYTAASPLEHAAAALQKYLGMRQVKQSRQGIRDTLGKQTAGRGAYADALSRLLGEQGAGPYSGSAPTMIE